MFVLQLGGAGAVLLTVAALTRAQITADAGAIAGRLRGELLQAYAQGGGSALRRSIETRGAPGRLPASVMLLVGRDGRYLAGNIADWPPSVVAPTTGTTVELFRIGHEEPEQMRIVATRLPGGERLMTGHVINSELRFAGAMEGAMASALVLALALAALAAWAAARMIEARLGATVRTSAAVAAGDLDRRVALTGGDDAFNELGASVNAMLDRIAGLMGELKIATDGLAHDLRSPLTRLRSMLERAQDATPDEGAKRAIGRALEEGDRLLAMLDTALRISRAEAGLGREVFVDTDIGALLIDMAEVYGPLAEDRGFTIAATGEPGLVAPVHRELLQQAIANLIDNALKYGAGRILLDAVGAADGGIVLCVADDGPGIPVERRGEALRRFGRLDAARSESGAGLGLTLAVAVARLHGGTLALADHAPGLIVRLTLAPADKARLPS